MGRVEFVFKELWGGERDKKEAMWGRCKARFAHLPLSRGWGGGEGVPKGGLPEVRMRGFERADRVLWFWRTKACTQRCGLQLGLLQLLKQLRHLAGEQALLRHEVQEVLHAGDGSPDHHPSAYWRLRTP